LERLREFAAVFVSQTWRFRIRLNAVRGDNGSSDDLSIVLDEKAIANWSNDEFALIGAQEQKTSTVRRPLPARKDG
jgi:hypothetical protein